MANTVIRVYDNFSAAQHARDALLASGFSDEEVQLTAREDEAGAVRSNFAIGNAHGGTISSRRKFSDAPMGSKENTDYQNDFAEPTPQQASVMLTVDAGDEARCDRACDIMDRYGAIDVEQRITGRSDRH
ncbi:hypothetical protein [Noviherbaspirillum massiliense]|uniref:hypothetical protein n=1 Tax=Noviherbaspirillum massiliense TaxID=1465823 RepID=UPI0011DDCBF9|nr:hypothetical protein [Noviherbaspirillum massiliense]